MSGGLATYLYVEVMIIIIILRVAAIPSIEW